LPTSAAAIATGGGLGFFTMQDELTQLLGRQVDLNTPGFPSVYFRDQVFAEARVQYEAA
jgi:uncharacterized protein